MYEDKIKWIEYKGKKIISVDYSEADTDILPAMFAELNSKVTAEPPGSVLYCISIVNLRFSVKTLSLFNKQSEDTKPYDKACAIIGSTGLVKVMYDGFSKIFTKPMKTFNKKEEALDWLADF